MILDTLSNGLKDLFAALGAKTSDSNYAVPLLNKTNGTPQGMMDMASLASVLGALKGFGVFKLGSTTLWGYECNAVKMQCFNDIGQTGVDIVMRIEDNSNTPNIAIKVRSSYNNVTGQWKEVNLV